LPQDLTDHVAVSLQGARSTGAIVLSAGGPPNLFQVRVHGTGGTLTIDFGTLTLTRTTRSYMPRAVDRAMHNFRQAGQLLYQAFGNPFGVILGRILPYQGLEALLDQFYAAAASGAQNPPISRSLAVHTTAVEDAILSQLPRVSLDLTDRPSRLDRPGAQRVLVTGGTGYLGRHVVARLVDAGYDVEVLCRPASRIDHLEQLGVGIRFGDLRDAASLAESCRGKSLIVHLAAGLRGSAQFIMRSTVEGMRNVAAAASAAKVDRVLYVSSMAVYDFSQLQENAELVEDSALDDQAGIRGPASAAKRQAEDIATEALRTANPSWSILRPAVIVGAGRPPQEAVGLRLGRNIVCLGRRAKQLRLIHVHDVADAIVRCLETDATRGKVYNLCQPERITNRAFVDRCVRPRYPDVRVFFFPRSLAQLLAGATRLLRRLSRRVPSAHSRRVTYLFRGASANSTRFTADTGWAPSAHLLDRLAEEAAKRTPSDAGT
jgi:nucleoside-diphosphate-sugar epimerase